MSYGLPNGTNLCGHGPSNTSGTSGSSVGVSLGGGGSSSGPSINVGVSGSWSYSIADVVVYNESEIVNNSVMITHDSDYSEPLLDRGRDRPQQNRPLRGQCILCLLMRRSSHQRPRCHASSRFRSTTLCRGRLWRLPRNGNSRIP